MNKKYCVSVVVLLLATAVSFAGESSSSTVYQRPRMSVETLLNLVGQSALPSNNISEKEKEANQLIALLVAKADAQKANDQMLSYLLAYQMSVSSVLTQISNSLVHHRTATSSTMLPVINPNLAHNGVQNQHTVVLPGNKKTKRSLSDSDEDPVENKDNNKKAKNCYDSETICKDCGLVFISEISCNVHKKSRIHKNKMNYTFICNNCTKRFETLAELKMHTTCDLESAQRGGRSHRKASNFICAPCGQTFYSQYEFDRHKKESAPHKKIMTYTFICDKNCEQRFETAQEREEHSCTNIFSRREKLAFRKKLTKIANCSTTTSSSSDALERTYYAKCEPCNKTLKNKQSYDNHLGTKAHKAIVRERQKRMLSIANNNNKHENVVQKSSSEIIAQLSSMPLIEQRMQNTEQPTIPLTQERVRLAVQAAQEEFNALNT